MRLVLALAALVAASPAAAERITTYWQLEPTIPSGSKSVAFGTEIFAQRILPVRLVRLSAPALPAGAKVPVAAGTLLYLVVNASGKRGFCTIKDRSAAAKSLFIPIADQRPCFTDRDGDGKLDASFSVFDAYTRLSPPQTRGSIDGAKPMAEAVDYETVDVHQFPAEMMVRYKLLGGGELKKSRLRVTVERPGHSDYVDLRGIAAGDGWLLAALGTTVTVRSVAGTQAEIDVAFPPQGFIYAENNGTVFLPALPPSAAIN